MRITSLITEMVSQCNQEERCIKDTSTKIQDVMYKEINIVYRDRCRDGDKIQKQPRYLLETQTCLHSLRSTREAGVLNISLQACLLNGGKKILPLQPESWELVLLTMLLPLLPIVADFTQNHSE